MGHRCVTCIHTQQGWAYLATIKDPFDDSIVVRRLGRNNSIELVTGTIKLAKRKETISDGLILHSNQGFQYGSDPYHILTTASGILPFMSRRGNCWDNALMENFFGHVKEEVIERYRGPSFHQAH